MTYIYFHTFFFNRKPIVTSIRLCRKNVTLNMIENATFTVGQGEQRQQQTIIKLIVLTQSIRTEGSV